MDVHQTRNGWQSASWGFAVDEREAESIDHQAVSHAESSLGSRGREITRTGNKQAAGHGFLIWWSVYTCIFRVRRYVRFCIFAAHPVTGISAAVKSCTKSGTGTASFLATFILPAAYGAVAVRVPRPGLQ